MGLDNYALASSAHLIELVQSLTNEDVRALASDLSALGEQNWLRWQIEHESEIQDYVSATPSTRERKKKWNEPTLRRKLVLCSIIHCQAAHALLRFLSQYEGALPPGGSYRGTTALAGSLFFQIWDTEIQDWPEPFDE